MDLTRHFILSLSHASAVCGAEDEPGNILTQLGDTVTCEACIAYMHQMV